LVVDEQNPEVVVVKDCLAHLPPELFNYIYIENSIPTNRFNGYTTRSFETSTASIATKITTAKATTE
jgi:hypothetical protein